MTYRLRVKDAEAPRGGMSRVTVLTSPHFSRPVGQPLAGLTAEYVRLSSARRVLGAVVEAVRPGPGTLEIDPLLRRELDLPEGGFVDVEALEPREAQEVQVRLGTSSQGNAELERLCRTFLSFVPLSAGQRFPLYLYSGESIAAEISRVLPADLHIATPATRFTFAVHENCGRPRLGFSRVGGLSREIQILRERILWPLGNREYFRSMGIAVPRGVLLTGPPGAGKTLMSRALAEEAGLPHLEVRGPEVFAKYYGESEAKIRELFADARSKAPAVILIDEIDAIAPVRGEAQAGLERRIVTALLAEMDGLSDAGDVVVVATTNDADAIDPALRRPGRFDFEVSLAAPSSDGRLEILRVHSRHLRLDGDWLPTIAARTHGFTGADLMSVNREAAFSAIRRTLGDVDTKTVARENLENPVVTRADFEAALTIVRPSALREFALELPGAVGWSDIGGLEAVKRTLVEEVVQAIANPDAYLKMGIRLVKGVLLYGPPGTGKTLLARVMASQAGANFISVRGPEVLCKWVGESERRLRHLFERARQASPCILFFDEVDALTARRGRGTNDVGDRIVDQLLTELDGFSEQGRVVVIAATNRKDLIDPALLRPGRFDHVVEVPLPTARERQRIFEIHLAHTPCHVDVDAAELAADARTREFSGAHIADVCRRAALEALRQRSFRPDGAMVTQLHLLEAVKVVRCHLENLERSVAQIGFRL